MNLRIVATLLPLLLTGCSELSEGSDEKMRVWFHRGTELTLPAEAKFIAGKNNSMYLSDIYLKLQVTPTYQETLDAKLKNTEQRPDLKLPQNMTGWSAWDITGREFIYYENTTGNVDQGGFISHLAFESSTGIMFCRIVEYAP